MVSANKQRRQTNQMYSIIWSVINNEEYESLLTNNNQTILYQNPMNANINSNKNIIKTNIENTNDGLTVVKINLIYSQNLKDQKLHQHLVHMI